MTQLSFETKLSVMTGLNFTATAGDKAVCPKEKAGQLESLVFQQIGTSAPCSIALASDHILYEVDKTQVDPKKFDDVYAWKKQDIIDGMEQAHQLSHYTGYNITSDHGILLLFNKQTDDFFKNAAKTKQLDNLLKASAEEGYNWTFMNEGDKQSGLAFYRKNNISPV